MVDDINKAKITITYLDFMRGDCTSSLDRISSNNVVFIVRRFKKWPEKKNGLPAPYNGT